MLGEQQLSFTTFPVPPYGTGMSRCMYVGLGRGRRWPLQGLPIPLLINGLCGE